MAEVKTFKCDICGKVYYSDDVKKEVKLTTKVMDEDSVECEVYDHVCPKCVGNITHYIADPGIVEKHHKTDRARQKLEDCLARLYHLTTHRSFWHGSVDLDYYDEMAEEVENDYKDMEKSRDLWKRLASLFIGLTTGMIIGLILKVIV